MANQAIPTGLQNQRAFLTPLDAPSAWPTPSGPRSPKRHETGLVTEEEGFPWNAPWGEDGYDKPASPGWINPPSMSDDNPWGEGAWEMASAVSATPSPRILAPKARAPWQASSGLLALQRELDAAMPPWEREDSGQPVPKPLPAGRAPSAGAAWLRRSRAGAAAWALWLVAAGRGVVWTVVGAAALAVAVFLGLASKTHRAP
jgi:hypothetical protein